jgi:uncharacterized membrane protein YhaH (DUF805 family)
MKLLLKLLFSFNGRISILWWWSGMLLLTAVSLPFELLLDEYILKPPHLLKPVIVLLWVLDAWGVLALHTKRLHDRNKSARWILIGFIPVLGALWLLVQLGFLRGPSGHNLYGKRNNFVTASGGSRPNLAAERKLQEDADTTKHTDIYH